MKRDFVKNDIVNPELKILLDILTGEDDIYIPETGLNKDLIIRLVLMHHVTGQFIKYARHHPGNFSAWHMETIDRRAKRNASRSLVQLHELIRISREFNRTGISYACMKGPQLSRMLYEKEALKESVDLDIMLVNASQLELVHRQLAVMGYDRSNLNDYQGWLARKMFLLGKREVHYFSSDTGCHVDLHVRAVANAYLTAGRFCNFFSDLQEYNLEGIAVPVLPSEQYLVFLCHHGAVHQFQRLAWLMDIRFFILRMADKLDIYKAAHIAESMKIHRSYYLAMCLLRDLFGDEIPDSIVDHYRYRRSMRFMISESRRIWSRDYAYMFTLRGRIVRMIYLMMLSSGPGGKFDLLLGVLIRHGMRIIRWLKI